MVFNILKYSVFWGLLLLAISGCTPDYHQVFMISNNTSDTLLVCLNENIKDREWKKEYCPGDVESFCYVDHLSNLENNSLEYTINSYYFSFRLYRHDSCLAHWNGKMQHLGDSIHNFYNYDSWTTTVSGKSALGSTYTITEDDLNPIPQTD